MVIIFFLPLWSLMLLNTVSFAVCHVKSYANAVDCYFALLNDPRERQTIKRARRDMLGDSTPRYLALYGGPGYPDTNT